MKKFLLTLSSVCLFAATLSAQMASDSLTADKVIPTSLSVFGRDIVSTVDFDSIHIKLDQPFDSATHNFISANFNGHGGAFVFDTNNSVHSSHIFTTMDTSGFVIMDSEAMGDDTQRVTLTSPAFNTNGINTGRVIINHHYKYSPNDSVANLMISTNGTTWSLLKSFSADAVDRGLPGAFVNDTVTLAPAYINKNTVFLRLVYASDSGYQWAVNNIWVIGESYDYTYSFFRKQMPNDTAAVNTVRWDLSGMEYDGNTRIYVRKAAPAPFRFIDSIYNDELVNLQHTTYDQNYFTTTGIVAHAHLTYSQRVSLQDVTGNSLDTLGTDQQFLLPYTDVHHKTRYPMFYNFATPSASTTWNSDFSFNDAIFLKGFGMGTPVARGVRRVHIVEKDTCIGWGLMRLTANGGYDSVWQVAISYRQVDTFATTETDASRRVIFNNYVNNTSGISNPLVQEYRMIKYYRKRNLHPFVTVYLQDTTITKIEVHTSQPFPVEVAAVETATNDIKVYPNPVTDHMVHVAVSNPESGQWNCGILNTVGQYIGTQKLNIDKANGNAVVNLPASIASGLYYLHITKDGETVTVKPVQVQ